MRRPVKILLQTTIPFTEDDWHIGRFSLLKELLESLQGEGGEPLYDVTAPDREDAADPKELVLEFLESAYQAGQRGPDGMSSDFA